MGGTLVQCPEGIVFNINFERGNGEINKKWMYLELRIQRHMLFVSDDMVVSVLVVVVVCVAILIWDFRIKNSYFHAGIMRK